MKLFIEGKERNVDICTRDEVVWCPETKKHYCIDDEDAGPIEMTDFQVKNHFGLN